MRFSIGFLLLFSMMLAGCGATITLPEAPNFSPRQATAAPPPSAALVQPASPAIVTSAYRVGETVPYREADRGKFFRIELMAFYKTPETDSVLARERANVRYPVSYAYPINTRIREGRAGHRFAECGLRADVTIHGLARPHEIGYVDVLRSGDIKIGTIRPTKYGPNSVTFENMDVDQVRQLVLPYQYVKDGSAHHRPYVQIVARNFTPAGPFAIGKELVFDMSHRVFSNARSGQGRINTGMLMPIEISPDEPACKGR